MAQRILAVAVLSSLIWTAPLLAQAPAGAATYRVTIVLYPGDDAAAVARRLAAMYRGTLETPVDGNGSFTMSLSAAGAGLMRRDPTVATMDAPSLAPPVPPTVASVNVAAPAAPGMVQTNATTSWSLGPYQYDGSGNIRAIGSDFYVYDQLGRVVVSADAAPSMPVVHKQTYTYDPYGNLSTINTAGRGSTTLATSGVSNRLATVSNGSVSAPVGYDGAGNFVSYEGATYEYDALNVMRKSVAGGVTRSYVYTANDERIGTIEQTGPTIRSEWTIRDGDGRVLRRFSRESNGEWKWQEDYIYRGGQMLAAEVPDSAKTRHFHLDHLGTPRLITGNGGAELYRHTYHPFGEEIAPGVGTREKKQFTGHERDSESLDYMHARFYAPFMGRFLSVDPTWDSADLGAPQSWNRYAYVRNNPIGNTDPDGRICIPCVVAGGAIGGLAGAGRESVRQIMSGEPVDNARLWSETGQGAAVGAATVLTLEAMQAAPALLSRLGAGAATAATKAAVEAQRASVDDKLSRYVLNPAHPVGGEKAKWFQQALGFTKANASELAKQLTFDPSKAVVTATTEHGIKYNQVHTITGANGKVIDVVFGWIKNKDGVVRLVTAIPTDR